MSIIIIEKDDFYNLPLFNLRGSALEFEDLAHAEYFVKTHLDVLYPDITYRERKTDELGYSHNVWECEDCYQRTGKRYEWQVAEEAEKQKKMQTETAKEIPAVPVVKVGQRFKTILGTEYKIAEIRGNIVDCVVTKGSYKGGVSEFTLEEVNRYLTTA